MTHTDTRLVPELFDERAARQPQAIAVTDARERIGYRQLARESAGWRIACASSASARTPSWACAWTVAPGSFAACSRS